MLLYFSTTMNLLKLTNIRKMKTAAWASSTIRRTAFTVCPGRKRRRASESATGSSWAFTAGPWSSCLGNRWRNSWSTAPSWGGPSPSDCIKKRTGILAKKSGRIPSQKKRFDFYHTIHWCKTWHSKQWYSLHIRNGNITNNFSNIITNIWNVIRKICSKSISRICKKLKKSNVP